MCVILNIGNKKERFQVMKLSKFWNSAGKLAARLQAEFKKEMDNGKKVTVVVKYSDGYSFEGIVTGIDHYSFGIMVNHGPYEDDCVELENAVLFKTTEEDGKIFLYVWR